MQSSLAFATDNRLPEIRARLGVLYPDRIAAPTDPVQQLIYAVLCEGLQGAAGLAVYNRVVARFPRWPDLMTARADTLNDLLVGIPKAEAKAANIPKLLRAIDDEIGVISLDHLARLSTDAAQRWLERLPGVTSAVAAAVLAFSTLKRPVVAIDRDSSRPIRRLELAPAGAPMSALPRHVVGRSPAAWTADDFSSLSEGLRRLGRAVCRDDRPQCENCPLSELCPTSGAHSADVVAFRPRRDAGRSAA